MRFMIKFEIPNDTGSTVLKEGNFGERMQQYLTEIHAESAYFTAINGSRGGYIVVDSNDNASMIAVCEPLFMWLNAKIEYFPVMNTDDIRKGNVYIQNAINKWSV